MMRLAILQPNYIPWKGYFDLIHSVDQFVILDTVQYTRSDWRNRNRIKTASGPRWLTIPVKYSSTRTKARICDVTTAHRDWPIDHWNRLREAYRAAPAFAEVAPDIENMYLTSPRENLADINRHFLQRLCRFLGIRTPLLSASALEAGDATEKSERLIALCRQLGATEYVSGPAARAYLDEPMFHRAGIRVDWFDYENYFEYPQLHPPFFHQVTVLDPIFHLGSAARNHVLRHPLAYAKESPGN